MNALISTGRIEPVEVDDRQELFDGRVIADRRVDGGDRRKSPRQKILKGGTTFWPNGDGIECGIRNLPETGAQLEVRSPVPNVFDLVIDRDQSRRSCCVIWRNATRIGVRFQEPHRLTREATRSRAAEFRQYAELCRTLAERAGLLHREMLLKMAETWEAFARRPPKRVG